MMKKIFICTAIVGLTVGIICLLCKTKKANNVTSNPMKEKSDDESETKIETPVDKQDVVNELNETKDRSAQTVYARHAEAAEIMTDAFNNILKEVEPVELEDETVEPIIDTQDVEVIKELDSLSDELDELLK